MVKRRIINSHSNNQVFLYLSSKKEGDDKNKWNDLARTLFKLSKGLYYRTGKQCRERWFNHLDPNTKQ